MSLMIVSEVRPGPKGVPGSNVLPVKVTREKRDLGTVDAGKLNHEVARGHDDIARECVRRSGSPRTPCSGRGDRREVRIALVFTLPSSSNVRSKSPLGRSRVRAMWQPLAVPATTILPSGWTATPVAMSLLCRCRRRRRDRSRRASPRATVERRVGGAVRIEAGDREVPVAGGIRGGADDDVLAIRLGRDRPVRRRSWRPAS